MRSVLRESHYTTCAAAHVKPAAIQFSVHTYCLGYCKVQSICTYIYMYIATVWQSVLTRRCIHATHSFWLRAVGAMWSFPRGKTGSCRGVKHDDDGDDKGVDEIRASSKSLQPACPRFMIRANKRTNTMCYTLYTRWYIIFYCFLSQHVLQTWKACMTFIVRYFC